MKRKAIVGAIMALGMITSFGSAMTVFADTMSVNAGNLNFRKGADMNAEVIRMLPRGTRVERTKDLGEWSEVTVGGIKGFVASRYLVNTEVQKQTVNEGSEKVHADAGLQPGVSGVFAGEINPYASQTWEVALDMNALYAGNSMINSGKAVYYKSNGARKEKTVCVNAGHGTKGGGSVKTLCHPDGTPKVTGGTTAAGATTAVAVSSGMTFADGTAESAVTLRMAQILRDKLLKEGYDVLMIRDGEDVQLDNIARTVLANKNADCHIAVHWDSTTSDKGCFYMSVPDVESYRTMEPVASHWQSHHKLGDALINGLKQAGNKIFSNGTMAMDLTQTSYSTIPSVDIELGDKASSHNDQALEKLADGLVSGVNEFFK